MGLALGFNPVLPVADAGRIAAQAENEGYDSFWMHESLFQRDVVTYMSAIIGSTSRLRVASGVINTFTRHPVTAATTFATLSELSKGRVTLGLGLGSFPTVPLIGHKIFPVKETRPLRRIKEYVDVVRKIWSGEKVNFSGEFFSVKDLTLGFKPAFSVPLFIASLSPLTLKYAGRRADGAILSPSLSTVEATAKMTALVREGEDGAGRRVEKASYMLTSVDRSAEAARDAVKGFYFFVYQLAEIVRPEDLEPYGITPERLRPLKEAWKRGDLGEAKRVVPDEAVDALTVTGSPDRAMESVRNYVRAGVTLPIMMPIGNVAEAISSMSPRSGWL